MNNVNVFMKDMKDYQRNYLTNEFNDWEFQRKRSYIGFPKPVDITTDLIKENAKFAVDILFQARGMITKLEELFSRLSLRNSITDQHDVIEKLIHELFQINFRIVDHHDPIIQSGNLVQRIV
jgi:hypothetical protein